MKAKGIIRFRLPSEKHLTTVVDALTPEAQSPISKQTKAVLKRIDNFFVLKVEATDAIALRAALNAYIRWLGSTLRVLEVVEQAS
jgi:tRNA threonylcarbamoyladenosine modification (KEOPS) complex  Pcc1 subunit